jgi:hypothetical protein
MHVFVTFAGGATCDDKANSSLSFEIFCNKFKIGNPDNAAFTLNDTDPCNPVI